MRTCQRPSYLSHLGAMLFLVFLLSGQSLAAGKHVVRIPLSTPEAIWFVEQYDLQSVLEFEAEVGDYLVSSEELEALRLSDIDYEYMSAFIEPPTVTELDPEYHTYAEVVEALHQYQIDYPHLVKLDSLGSSFEEGRTVWGLRISDNPTLQEDEPQILLDGNHHACELMGTEICMRMIDELLHGYGVDSTVTFWVDNIELFIVPIVNPDGRLVVENGISYYWRKNTRDTNGNNILYEYQCNNWWTCRTDGVDLNRNYGHNWEYGNPDPWAHDYRGEYPYSEGEIEGMRNLSAQEHFLMAFTYHSYGEIVLYPWGERPYTPDDDVYTQLAGELASEITSYGGSGIYDYGRESCERGMASNYHYAVNRTYCFTIETLPYPYFIIPGDEIEGVYEDNKPSIFWAFEKVCHGPGISGHVINSSTGEAVVAEITIEGRPEQSGVNLRKSESGYGRFDILLLEGSYTLHFHANGYEDQTISGVEVASYGWTPLEAELVPLHQSVGGEPHADVPFLARIDPNPFNSAARLHLELPHGALVALQVFNLKGQRVANPFEKRLPAGTQELVLALPDEPSGVYFYRLEVNGNCSIGKMVLLK
jgi:murein tripeptide amidase MpaA